ncbi:MAG: DNA topoisomerase I [Lachnospiraceae bacterium]|nr:DNA topoisomerase I [Lachnospiraceae bacterium]
MAQKTVALSEGKYIGIESIYTVINGRQINIPDKLKDLRAKSRRNELFCPCGCGTNLILVAGDKNLREQHFKKKPGTGIYECNMPTEGKISVNSKIVLKCWLDDKLKVNDVESRVQIDTVEDTKRKPEFTFLSMTNKFAIRYWRTRANVLDDKLEVLAGNLLGIKVVYIVDESNGGINGQYPELLMKLQDRQSFCLLLSIQEAEYDKACLKAVFYEKDLDGLWKEVVFADGKLCDFTIVGNEIIYAGNTLEQILETAKVNFYNEQQIEKERRAEQERLRAEYIIRMQVEEECLNQEQQRQREEMAKQLRMQKEEAEKRQKEHEEKIRREAERQQEERRQREEEFRCNMESNLSQQKTQVRDAEGNRWIKCEFCGKIAIEDEFNNYGGAGHINLGTCAHVRSAL